MSNSILKTMAAIAVAGFFASACTQELSSEERLTRAEAAMAGDDTATAIIELKNALKQDSSNAAARLLLGLAYFESGDVSSAEKELQLAGEPGDTEDRSRQQSALARSWVDMGKYEEVFSMSLQNLTPEARADVLAAKAQAYLVRSDLEAAAQRVATALEADPDSVYALYTDARVKAVAGENEAALEQIARVAELDPEYAPVWALRGDVDWRVGDGDAAETDYSRAIELAPNNPGYRMKRAFSRISSGSYDGAQRDLDFLLKLAPQSSQINYAQGLLYFRQGNYQDAVSALLIAEADKFTFPDTLLYLGMANAQLGDMEKAYAYAQEFHALDEDNVQGNRFLANLWVTRGKYEQAETMARKLLEANPDDTSALNTLASSLISQQRTDEAIQVLNRVVEIEPDSAQAQVRLGAGYLTAGRTDEAVDLVEGAIGMDPESGQPDTVLVYTHLHAGEYDAALRAAEDYAERKPDIPQPRLLQGLVQKRMGDVDAAKQSFRLANELEPGQPAANHQLAAMAFAEGDLDTARGYYRAVLEERRDFLPTLIALAALEGFARNFDEMEKLLSTAMEAHPESLQPRLALGRYYMATGQVERVGTVLADLPAEQAQSPAVLRVQAMSDIAQRDFAAAQTALETALESTEASVQDRRLLAYALEQQGDMAGAEAQLAQALEMDPESLPLQLSLARYAFQRGHEGDFSARLQALKERAPDNPLVLQLEAAKARKDGDQERALALFERAQALQPGTAGLVNLLQQYDLMGQRDNGTELLSSWSKENDDDATAKGLLALRLQQSGDTQGAIDRYQEFLELDPDNVAALNNLAWLIRHDDSARALEYARRAETLSSGAPAVRDTVAMVLSASGKHAEADSILAELIRAHPDEPSFRYHQAVVAEASGNTDKARTILSELLEGEPRFGELDEARKMLAALNGG